MTHPMDQAEPTMPPTEFQLRRIKVMLHWIDEHARSAKKHHDAGELLLVNMEFGNLVDSVDQCRKHLQRLEELLREGQQLTTK